MQLIDLLNSEKDLLIAGLTSDSRQVRKNYLFAALPGSKLTGSQFIEDAIHNGASIILADEGISLPKDTPEHVALIQDKNPRQVFAKLAAKFYKLQPEHIVAVTGTSGKTSTVSFIQQLWHLSGNAQCASLGTLGVRGPGIRRYGSLTTPDTQSLHAELADLAAVGINHLAMEASSHGLDQYRLDGVRVEAAGFTNLSRDHLDYHKDMDEYFMAKARLFTEVMRPNGVGVINVDDEYGEKLVPLAKKAGHEVMTYGVKGEHIKLLNRVPKPDGQDISIEVLGKKYDLTLPLVGEFQVMNALCALGLLMAKGGAAENFVPHIENLRGVPGRLQLVAGHKSGAIYVDYAHKPAALEAILKTLRPHTECKLVCVFGCGGNRDPGKREMMGKIAGELADIVIVTDDNPRYEDASAIRAQIMEAVPTAREIGDRAIAIQTAVKELSDGDVLVVAGKGHEQGQIIGDTVHVFDDVEEVKKAIESV